MKRKDKRKILSGKNFFEEFLVIKKHFFKELNLKLNQVKDIRQSGKITYTVNSQIQNI